MTTSAKVIADSISEQGVRITTLELSFERYLLAQLNTHRMFSRSASSSRAVPVAKMIDAVFESPVIPNFMKNEKGMQSTVSLDDSEVLEAKQFWCNARSSAVFYARCLVDLDVHKQFANRLLEPFSTINVVVTATEWDNFFKLRLHHAAQPEMQSLAMAMKTAMDESEPKILFSNHDWHLPYIDGITLIRFERYEYEKLALISAARCARVSYLNHDNSTPNIEKDLELSRQLLAEGHLSPFEHQAKPIDDNAKEWQKGVTHIDYNAKEWSANFRGWLQFRQLLTD